MTIKLAAIIGAVLACIGLGYYVGGLAPKAALSRLQDAWDKDKLAIQQATDKAVAQATAERDMALKANEAISNDYQTKLDAANAGTASLAQRLRDAERRAAANSGTLPKTPSQPGATPTATPSGLGQLTDILTAALTECRENSAQLESLIGEIKTQL